LKDLISDNEDSLFDLAKADLREKSGARENIYYSLVMNTDNLIFSGCPGSEDEKSARASVDDVT
jgi:hypothetical protein